MPVNEYIGDLESSIMFDESYFEDDDSDEDPTFEDPDVVRGSRYLGKRKRNPSESSNNKKPKYTQSQSIFDDPVGFRHPIQYSASNTNSNQFITPEKRIINQEEIQAESQVRQLLFEHFQRVSMGSFPRKASLDILKEKMSESPEYVKALGRIHERAESKGTRTGYNTRRIQGIQSANGARNHVVPSTLGSYVSSHNDKPNPPLVKQKLDAAMASSLLNQTSGSNIQSMFQNSFESEVNKVTEEEIELMSDLDKKIYETLQHCESISIRLRKSLQENLQELLETNSLSNTNTNNNDNKTEDNEKITNDSIVKEQPNILQLALKEYQLVGLNWLNLLHEENVNGILADEMGLGKTIQTISLLALLYEKEIPDIPHLIICPSTTLTNWLRELNKWCPVFKVIAYFGSPNERDLIKQTILKERIDIIVTTYNIAGQKTDRLFLKKREFNYVILDEAQNIKNNQSLRHKYLRKLDSRHRLLLTGTPLQNNIDELWALLQFIMPDLFDFDIDFQNEENSGINPERVDRIKAIMAPFVLRRLKQHVSRGLPDKTESVQLCDMTPIQKEIYISCVKQSKSWWDRLKTSPIEELEFDKKDDIVSDIEDDSTPKRKRGRPKKGDIVIKPIPEVKPTTMYGKTLSNVFMQLRKIANHPLLVRTYYSEETIDNIADYLLTLDENKKQKKNYLLEDLHDKSDFKLHELCKEQSALARYILSPQQLQASGKIQLLKKLLQQLHTDGHRVLIFSQMTRVLDILEEVLGIWGYEHLRLDGSTPVPVRQGLIDEFNDNENVFIFLLSTRAGGVGINLTSADTVIFYDIAFNPQVDRQAEDRCHRFGQEKPVTIYKLITSKSVDQNMLQMADRKAKLNDIILEEGTRKKENTKVWQLRSLLSSVFEEIQAE